MLRINARILIAIEQGVLPAFKAVVYWQEPEIYTEDDLLVSVGDLTTAMSEGRYEIANTSVVLKNDGFYFSKRLAKELPNNKLVEIYMTVLGEDILVFKGIVPKEGGWTLTETELTLNVNA